MTHVRTAPYYPQSNGRLERYHKTIKGMRFVPASPARSRRRALVTRFVEHYNTVRLHSAIDYITPADFFAGRGNAIWAERDRRLDAAREVRHARRAEAHQSGGRMNPSLSLFSFRTLPPAQSRSRRTNTGADLSARFALSTDNETSGHSWPASWPDHRLAAGTP
jgi:hypothetical protein